MTEKEIKKWKHRRRHGCIFFIATRSLGFSLGVGFVITMAQNLTGMPNSITDRLIPNMLSQLAVGLIAMVYIWFENEKKYSRGND